MVQNIESLILEAISAFLGFLFALLLNHLIEKKAEEKRINLIVKLLYEEISDIYLSLEKYVEYNKSLDRSIQTPSWESVQNSGLIVAVIEHDFYRDLVDCFSKIKWINEDLTSNRVTTISVERIMEICEEMKMVLTKLEKKGVQTCQG